MPSLYSKMMEVMAKLPESREDSQLEYLQTWFRRNIVILANIEREKLHRLLKTVELNSFRSEIVITNQGEVAEWMYVVLRGRLSVFQMSDVIKPDVRNEEERSVQPVINPRKPVRIQLGQFVMNLESGSSFGEMALLRNGHQMSSVISDDVCHLLVIGKATFDACLRETLADLVAEKQRFISHAYCFAGCMPNVQYQLMMMMKKRTYQYNEVITHQGDPAKQVFFILSGEVKILMDPDRHLVQSPKIDQKLEMTTLASRKSIAKTTEPALGDNAGTGCDSVGSDDTFRNCVRDSLKSNFLPVSLTGVNETIGDFELILKFDSYLQTTVCTRMTEVLILSQSNFERVLGLKNGSRVLELLLEKSFLRLRCRLSTVNGLERRLPILGTLLKITEEYRNSLLQHPRGPRFDVDERLKELDLRRSRVSNRTMADFYCDYIPSHGLLVDQFGRGTVFDRIRRQEKMRRNQKQKLQESFAAASEARVRRRRERAGSLDTASDISNRTIVRKKPSHGKFSD